MAWGTERLPVGVDATLRGVVIGIRGPAYWYTCLMPARACRVRNTHVTYTHTFIRKISPGRALRHAFASMTG